MKDITQAMYWYTKAAEHNNTKASYRLAEKYEQEHNATGKRLSCKDVINNKMKAITYYKQAFKYSNAGNVAYDLAKIYMDGSFGMFFSRDNNCVKNVGEALKYFELASTFNSTYKDSASAIIANDAFEKKKYNKALKYYLVVVDNINPDQYDSKHNDILTMEFKVGYLYENGLGTPKNPAKAMLYYSRAANGGLIEAQQNLRVLKNRVGSFKPA